MNCWLNGVMLDAGEARIDPRDRGFLLGDGIFETLLAVDGGVRHLPRHMARLFAAAQLLGIPAPHSKDELAAAMAQLLQENSLLRGRAALRLTLTRGVGARGLAPPPGAAPSILLTAVALPPAPEQVRAIMSTYVRNEKSISSRIKSLNYLDNIMARREAAQCGAGEALMRNSMGGLACASAANLFVVTGGVLRTPPVSDGALPGIMRAIVLERAAALNIPSQEASIAQKEMDAASEAFLTSALIGVCPLVQIDATPVGNGAPGPVTQALRV